MDVIVKRRRGGGDGKRSEKGKTGVGVIVTEGEKRSVKWHGELIVWVGCVMV